MSTIIGRQHWFHEGVLSITSNKTFTYLCLNMCFKITLFEKLCVSIVYSARLGWQPVLILTDYLASNWSVCVCKRVFLPGATRSYLV
jgi:hypothetical protein